MSDKPTFPRSNRLRRNRFLRASAYYGTAILGTRLARYLPMVFVPGYPKSGTTWACQMIGDYLQIPFPRWYLLPLAGEYVVHGHGVVSPRCDRVVYTVRDGRDVMVSLYYFLAKRLPEGGRRRFSRRQARWFPAGRDIDDVMGDIRRHLPAFIESQMRNAHSSRATSAEHVAS